MCKQCYLQIERSETRPASPDHILKYTAQSPRVNRLRDEIFGAGSQRLYREGSLPLRHADQDVCIMILSQQRPDDGNAIHIVHCGVQHDDIGPQSLELLYGLPTAFCLTYDMVAARRQMIPEDHPVAECIICD